MPPTDADRSKARRYRRARKKGLLTAAETAWLDEYERTQKQTRAHEPKPPSPSEPASASSAPVHTTEVVTAPEASSWASVPLLPPGSPEDGAVQSPDQPQGEPGSSPPPQTETPIADAPPPPGPTEDEMQRGAARFAALVVGLNALGIKAGLELAPAEVLGQVDALLGEHMGTDIAKVGSKALGVIGGAAFRVAMKHPLLCRSIPYEDEAVVLGSTAGSIVALYFRYIVKREEHEQAEAAPAPAPAATPKPAPTSPPKNGAATPQPAPVNFGELLRDHPEADA